MERASIAARRHVDLAWVGLGIGDELGNRLRRNRWIHFHDKGDTGNARHRRSVADEIEIKFLVQRGVDCIRRSGQEERIAVRCRAHDRLGGDVAAGVWPVLNNELLTEPLREPLSYQTRDDVARTTGAIADDDAYRPRRIGLRP